ncbi:exported hypothetical protein [Nitrospina gracilis 3/211]|uniref:Uncharacterized protein n=1 Tax=Nitrospina gracilis (strain 3/211) TaxID=1266370 RepID=M1YXS9_NITG3|nr:MULTISPECIES: tetratricopeptide repeat protein [Nitrospina]MCF8723238.1 tetratricopeptide (TPR) repeat protein [Nitrospina sp. Nb-3]CCQ90287.1 exported hypothetical protein [Nitrospina gracilis 3/211]
MLNIVRPVKWSQLLIFFLLMTMFASCANPINRVTFRKYIESGNVAENRGNLELARENYKRALINVNLGNLSEEEWAYAAYEYGRISGYLCDHEEAEKYMLQSLEIKERLEFPLDFKAKSYFELARFYYDSDQYAQSIPYFDKGIQLAEILGGEKTDPIAFANILDEHASALRKTGAEQQADTIAKRAETIREQNSGQQAHFKPTRYNQNCPKTR